MGSKVYQKVDEDLYNAFWRKLQQFKFDITYFSVHFDACVKALRWIKYSIVGGTAIATGVWMTWNNVSGVGTVSAVLILLLQALSAISEWFPYENRKLELREMLTELEPLYIDMENEWRKINRLEKTDKQIQGAILRYSQKQLDIKNHFFKDDSLPIRKRLEQKATILTSKYFEYFT